MEGHMNTANLELEGLCLAIASINNMLVEKGLLTHADVQQAMGRAADVAEASCDQRRMSAANRLAILFPARFLKLASERTERGEPADFRSITEAVGRLNGSAGAERRPAGPGDSPGAGPHAKPELTDNEKTPGAGVLPDASPGEVDPGAG
jgi:hypothetical protein